MIKRITKVSDSLNLNDELQIDLSEREDPYGRSIEPDRDFTITYRDDQKIMPSSDTKFKPDKKYYYRNEANEEQRRVRSKEATPVRLGLFVNNGLNYTLSRDKKFEPGRTYYFQNDNGLYLEANPNNLHLSEMTPPTHIYYYPTFKTGNPRQPSITLCGTKGESWETAKEIFDWGKQHRDDIIDQYSFLLSHDPDNLKDVRIALQSFVYNRSTFRKEREIQNKEVRGSNARNVTANIRQTRTGTKYGHPELIRSVLNHYELTYAQIDPATEEYKEIFRQAGNEELKNTIDTAQKEAFGFIVHYSGKYIIASRRLPNTKESRLILSMPSNSSWYRADTIEQLIKKQNRLSEILQDFKDELITPEEARTILSSDHLLNDSVKNINSFLEDDALEPVYKDFGVYFNPNNNKYLVNIITPNRKLIRLGEFDNARTARLASQAFKNEDYDPFKFVESNFYLDNIQYFKNFYQMYVEGKKAPNAELSKLHTEKQENGRYMVYYDNNGEKVFLNKEFPLEARALQYINEILRSGDPLKYINNFNSSNQEVNEEMGNLGVRNTVKNAHFTYTDMKNMAEILGNALKNVDADTARTILSGPLEEHGKLFLNVKDFVKEKLLELGFSEEQAEFFIGQYHSMLAVQDALTVRVMRQIISEKTELFAQNTIDGYWAKLNKDAFIYKMIKAVYDALPFKRQTYDKEDKNLTTMIIPSYYDYLKMIREDQ